MQAKRVRRVCYVMNIVHYQNHPCHGVLSALPRPRTFASSQQRIHTNQYDMQYYTCHCNSQRGNILTLVGAKVIVEKPHQDA